MWHFAPTREDHQAVANGYKSFEILNAGVPMFGHTVPVLIYLFVLSVILTKLSTTVK